MKHLYRTTNIIAIANVVLFCFIVSGCSGNKGKSSHFKKFPLAKTRAVTFDVTEGAFSELTDKETLEQVRDWLLFTTLSGSDFKVEQINQSSYDLPGIRRGYLRPVANYEHGEMRSYYIGDGNVVVLIPVDQREKRSAFLAHAADQHRKNTGEQPKAIVVFDYKINWNKQAGQLSAEITRRETLEAKQLFTQKYGYQENKINSVDDLKSFMKEVNDITFARMEDNALILGGRKTDGAQIDVEDVAALFQSEVQIQAALKEVNDSWKREVEEREGRLAGQTFRTDAERDAAQSQLLEELKQLREQRVEELRKKKIAPSSGFSLDPTYDFDGLKSYFHDEAQPLIRSRLSSLPNAADRQRLERDMLEASQGLATNNTDELFDLIKKLYTVDGTTAKSISEKLNSLGYQAARYDGYLKGTNAGMILFYTDLLAKIWAIDYVDSTPSEIADFKAIVDLLPSPIYRQELMELDRTRLWFGPQRKGFQKAGAGQSLLFARNSTRLFSASSSSLKSGVEHAPNIMSATFIEWWDDHFEEVARFEPAYERLNEIMKWSLVIGWLNETEQGERLGFLKGVPVNRTYWFPDWIRQHPELKARHIENIVFFAPGNKNTSTEALPLLSSREYHLLGDTKWVYRLSGGVSLGSKSTLQDSGALTPETKISRVARRSNLDYKPMSPDDSVIRTIDGTTYRLTNLSSEQAMTSFSPKPNARLRGRDSELAHTEFERTISRTGDGLHIETKAAKTDIGSLEIENTEKGFKVAWNSRDIDAGQILARRLSSSTGEPAEMLASSSIVEMCIQLPGEHRYLVSLRDSNRWMELSIADAAIESKWQARVADVSASSRNVNLSWIDKTEVAGKLGQNDYLIVPATRDASKASRLQVSTSGPAGSGRNVEFQVGELTVNGVAGLDGATYIKLSELPPAIRAEPNKLSLGWRRDTNIKISKLDDGTYNIHRGPGGQASKASSMPNLIDVLVEAKASESLKNESLLLELSGFTYDEAIGMLKSTELRVAGHGERSSLTSIFRDGKSGRGPAFESLTREYDFAQARISELQLNVMKKGTHAGASEVKLTVEIPAKVVNKPSYSMRMRMLFKKAFGSPKLKEIAAGVKRVLRIGLSEESNMDLLAIGISNELRRIHPEIRSIHTEYKSEILDLMIVKLLWKRKHEWCCTEDRWPA